MALIFHRLVQKDLRTVLEYYTEEGGAPLADRFFAEIEALVARIATIRSAGTRTSLLSATCSCAANVHRVAPLSACVTRWSSWPLVSCFLCVSGAGV